MDALILRRSIYVLCMPIFMIFAALACAGTPLTEVPVYICPTPILEPTATTLAGTTVPTLPPPPTPFIIIPPQDFYVGDEVFVGGISSPVRVRFRLQSVMTFPAPPDDEGASRQVYAWELVVYNAGTQDYQVFPAVQMWLSEVLTDDGTLLPGTWVSAQAAAEAAGLVIDPDLYTLPAGETRIFRFAVFAPLVSANRFTFVLDPTLNDGSGTITWINQTNPYCSGDVAD